MVIVQGMFKVNAEDRDDFIGQSLEQIRISRTEKGCLEYVMAADPLEADRVVLSERWATMEDLTAHIDALTARRSETPPGDAIAPLDLEISRFEVTSSEPLA